MDGKVGRQTPTQSFVIPYEISKGEQAAKLYELTGRKAMPWQRRLLNDIMAQNGSGLWTHSKFGYSVPRRNGKTEVIYAREACGLLRGEKILHTAHRTTTAHASWESLYELLKAIGIPIAHTYRASGREHIYLKNGGRIEYRTRTAKGGLGEGYDLLVIDEAQEYQADQETALKYIVTASKNPQTIMLGTPPTKVSVGTVFPEYRDRVLAGEAEDAGWAEWSVDKMTPVRERKAWYEANPALGYILTERSIASEITGDETDFNIQRLGLWVKYDQKSEISQAEWLSLKVKAKPVLTGPLFAGIKYGKNGENTCLSVAVRTVEGRIFIESIDCRSQRSGDDWILEFLHKADLRAIVIDGAGGQQILKDRCKAEKIKPVPVLPSVKEIIVANALFEQGITEGIICHSGQAALTQSVSNCKRRNIGSSGGFGFESLSEDIEVGLMESAALAYWACATAKKEIKQKISY